MSTDVQRSAGTMKAADVAPGMVFGCWRVIGPACPEFRERSIRFVEVECWCRSRYEIRAHSLVIGKSRRCKPCELGRRRAIMMGQTAEAIELKAMRTKRAERLAMIRRAAEAHA